MEKPHIYKYDEVDINNIEYGDPVKKGQSYKCSLSYDRKPLYIQTPVLKCVSSKDELLNKNIFKLQVSQNQLSFYIWFQNLDNMNKNKAHLNSNKWFSKNIPMDIIENYYSPFLNKETNFFNIMGFSP